MKKYFLLLLVTFVGCSETQQQDYSIQKADDLQVIKNEQPEYEGQFWTFSDEPILEIGVKDGEKAYMFYRLSDAIRLVDGRILASNAGTHELRYYDEEGNYLRSFGGNGRGPGEFGDFSNMNIYRYGKDSIVVNDSGNDRMNIYDIEGHLGRTVIVEPIAGAGNPNIINLFSDGSWLVWSTLGSARLEGQPGDLIEKEYLLHRLQKNGDYDTELFSFPSRPQVVHEAGGIRRFPLVPLYPSPIYLPDNSNNVLYSTAEEPEILRINQNGINTAVFKWQMPRTKVSEIWDEHRKDYLSSAGDPDEQKFYRSFLQEDLPVPDTVPALAEIHVDRLGYIWAQRFDLSWADWEQNTGTDILSPDGRWLGTLQLPQGINIYEIGEDYLLGSRYKDGVETLVQYTLNRKK